MWPFSNKRLAALKVRILKERAEAEQLRQERVNTLQAINSGTRAIETMGHMIKMVAK